LKDDHTGVKRRLDVKRAIAANRDSGISGSGYKMFRMISTPCGEHKLRDFKTPDLRIMAEHT
jgi:hypothetical protein